MATPITINVPLEPTVAHHLTQFCKRITFDMFYDMTESHVSHEEGTAIAYQVISGIEVARRALADTGC